MINLSNYSCDKCARSGSRHCKHCLHTADKAPTKFKCKNNMFRKLIKEAQDIDDAINSFKTPEYRKSTPPPPPTSGSNAGKIDTRGLMANTLQIDKCERIIFRDKTLDFVFEIGHDQYKDIDTIIVNGIKFVKES